LFSLLGIQPALGRSFAPEENKPGSDKAILLSYKLWQRRFGGDQAIVGRTITLDHTNNYSVVGVMPPDVNFPGQSEFWTPETVMAAGKHDMRMLSVVARLKPSVTLRQAEAELGLINKQLQQQYPDAYDGWDVEMLSLHDSVVGKVRLASLVLLRAVGGVLRIACA